MLINSSWFIDKKEGTAGIRTAEHTIQDTEYRLPARQTAGLSVASALRSDVEVLIRGYEAIMQNKPKLRCSFVFIRVSVEGTPDLRHSWLI